MSWKRWEKVIDSTAKTNNWGYHSDSKIKIENRNNFKKKWPKIEDMEMEMRKFGPNSRASMNNKLKQYKLDVDIIQKEMVFKIV